MAKDPRIIKAESKIIKFALIAAYICGFMVLYLTSWKDAGVISRLFSVVAFGALTYLIWKALNGNVCNPLFCPKCEKSISKNLVWRCAYCDSDNDNEKHPITEKCGTCFRVPKSYCCQHCEEIIFLDSDNDGSKPARSNASAPKKDSSRSHAPDPKKLKELEHIDRKIALMREIEITQLTAQLEALKASPVFKKEVAKKESIAERFSSFETHTMGVHMFAKQKREEYEERFKDDPDFLEQANESLQAFVEEQLVSAPDETK
jgi:hypothetical protein